MLYQDLISTYQRSSLPILVLSCTNEHSGLFVWLRQQTKWAGHVERMADDRLPKRAAEIRDQGRRRRGRLRPRCEDGRRGGRLEEEDKRQLEEGGNDYQMRR